MDHERKLRNGSPSRPVWTARSWSDTRSIVFRPRIRHFFPLVRLIPVQPSSPEQIQSIRGNVPVRIGHLCWCRHRHGPQLESVHSRQMVVFRRSRDPGFFLSCWCWSRLRLILIRNCTSRRSDRLVTSRSSHDESVLDLVTELRPSYSSSTLDGESVRLTVSEVRVPYSRATVSVRCTHRARSGNGSAAKGGPMCHGSGYSRSNDGPNIYHRDYRQGRRVRHLHSHPRQNRPIFNHDLCFLLSLWV